MSFEFWAIAEGFLASARGPREVTLPTTPDDFGKRPSLARSIGWSALAQFVNLVLTVGSAMVLARLLGPNDYAVMAAIVPVVGAAQTVQALGLGSAIVRAETINKHQLDALFWLVMVVSLALACVVALGGPVLARSLAGLRLEREYAFAALALVTSALGSQPVALLARGLRFRVVALTNIFASGLGIVVTIALAFFLRNHWALLVAPVVVPLASGLLASFAVRWFPGLPRRAAGLRPLLHFGVRIWGTNLLNFVSRNADNLIVASASTPFQLGIYDRSCRVVIYPLTQAVTPLGQVLIPTLTRNIANPELYRRQYWHVSGLLLFATLPGLCIITAFPTTLIGSLLGEAWVEGGPLFGWFAGAAMAEVFIATFTWLMISQGRGSDVLRAGFFNALVALSSFFIGIQWGILGVAVAFTAGRTLLCLPCAGWLAGNKGAIDHAELARGSIPHVAAVLATIAGTWTIRLYVGSPDWPMLITSILIAYGLYLLVLGSFPNGRSLGVALLALGRRSG